MNFFQSATCQLSSVQLSIVQFKKLIWIFLTLTLVACGGTSSETSNPPLEEPPITVTEVPSNKILSAFFRDQDGAIGQLSGIVTVEAAEIIDTDPAKVESVWVYWADEQGNKQGDVWLKTDATAVYHIEIPTGTNLPESTKALLMYPTNTIGQATKGTLISFHDFIGYTELSGPGG